MSAGIWFWIIYIIAVLFSSEWYWRHPILQPYGPIGLVLFILIGLLGWGTFGSPIR